MIERLSKRQRDCLRLVGQGYTSKEIGRALGISPATVDNHVRSSLDTLNVQSRAEAARILLAAEGDDQPLTSQPPTLAEVTDDEPTPLATGQGRPGLLGRLVPPLGGELHALDREQKLFAILRVAFVGFSSLLVITLGIMMVLWLLS